MLVDDESLKMGFERFDTVRIFRYILSREGGKIELLIDKRLEKLRQRQGDLFF